MEEEYSIHNNREKFKAICSLVSRPGIENLMAWLEKSDFYSAPASTRFHGSYPGGLLDHSIHVYEQAKRLLSVYPEIQVSDESLIITTLFHDLCKVNFYDTEKRNRKNASGQWESYDAYTIHEKFCYGGHGAKSVFIIQSFIHLSPDEAAAIHCHMSSWDGNKDVGSVFERNPYAWLLHVADEAATYLDEVERE